jgi:hypothetical protein
MKKYTMFVLFVFLTAIMMISCINPIGFIQPQDNGAGAGAGAGSVIGSGEGQQGEADPSLIADKSLALLYTNNLSKSAAIQTIKATLTSPAETFTKGPVPVNSVYSTTHTASVNPEWRIEITYKTSDREGTLIINRPLLKLGYINFINKIWFYKGTDGDYHLDPSDNCNGIPGVAIDPNDLPDDKKDTGTIRIYNRSKSTDITAVIDPSAAAVPGSLNVNKLTQSSSKVKASETYSLHVTYTNSAGGGTVSPDFTNIHIQPAAERAFYFYKNLFGDFVVSDNPGDADPNDLEPGINGGGPGEDGEGGNPDDYPNYDPAKLGVLVVRNLTSGDTHGRKITSVVFSRTAKGPYSMIPGPNMGSERGILLSPGNWNIDLYYETQAADRDDGDPVGKISKTKMVVAASAYVNYIYFYKNKAGNYAVETGNTIPSGDLLDEANTTITVGDGMGIFEITNSSSAGSIIAQVKWMGVNYPVTIAQGNKYRLEVPAGTGNLSFRITTKTTFGIELAYTLRARETIPVNYMDSFENTSALPPPGSSSIVIDNQSTFTVNKLIIYNRAMVGTTIPNTALEPPGPVGPNRSASKIVPNMGEVVIQVYMSQSNESIVLSRSATLSDTVVLIAINRGDTDDGTGKGTDDGETTVTNAGGLRVFNHYRAGESNAPDMKIFKIHLYEQDSVDTNGVPIYAANPTYTWNGTGIGVMWDGSSHTTGSTYNPILRAGNDNMFNIPQGYYKLVIVATTYPWQAIVDNLSVPGITGGLTEALISYDCGEVMIANKVERQYYFDVASGKEKDAPRGYAAIYIQYTGVMGGSGALTYHPAAFEEFAIPPKDKVPSINDAGTWAPTNAQKNYNNWPGKWTNQQTGVWASMANRALLNTQILNYNSPNIGPFYLPPGRYYVRYGDTYGGSGRIFGEGSDTVLRWRAMDISDCGGRTVTVSLDPSQGVSFVKN